MSFVKRRASSLVEHPARIAKSTQGKKAAFAGLACLFSLVGCTAPTEINHASAANHVASAQEPDVAAPPKRLRLISQEQYFNTISDLFGKDVVPNVTFAPFQRTDGLLASGAAYEDVTEAQIELYQRAAALVADLVVSPERRSYLIPCKPADEKAADNTCATQYLAYIGQRLFRRPLTPAKLQEVVSAANASSDRLHSFYTGLSLALEGLLLSPKTLYIEEIAEPDPNNSGALRLDGYSLASRLSFFLWNQAPDDDLLKAAASGDLHSAKGRTRVVDTMLANPKLEMGLRSFFDDMMGFDQFQTLAKDATVYPAFTGAAAIDAREQTLRLLVDILITQRGDYRDIFTTRETFISKSLAQLYQQPIATKWSRYDSPPDSARVGLLTQISFLTLHSHPGRSSPTLRGKALREILMCQTVPRPPANVDFSAVENPDPSLKTARDRLDFHRRNPVCAGCHKITDPIGLALEHFDGAGVYRDTEKGATIDSSGSLDGKSFKDVVELGQVLRDNPAVTSCAVRRLYAYGIGGKLRKDDDPVIAYLNEGFAREGYRFPSLMKMVALSEAFSEVNAGQASRQTTSTATATVAN